jgi:hypothetical protein
MASRHASHLRKNTMLELLSILIAAAALVAALEG